MLSLRKFFKLPSPVDLGWSHNNALESRMLSDNPQGKTWEDWEEHVKKTHPVRAFLALTLADFLYYSVWLRIWRPIKDAHYWLVSHVYPSRRYHMLDLRQPGGYQYGWADVPEKMLYAMFNLLGEYLKEDPTDLTVWYTFEQIEEDTSMKVQQDNLNEARAIYHWWVVTRKESQKEIDDLRNKWFEAKKEKDPQSEEYYARMRTLEDQLEAKFDEMIARLMKIRRSLWT